ncbi:hypothetical protein CK230_17195 [Mesorhizobium sp. WSM3859]|nr:hypothetical protein CK230_17195 [Mesorhizobium sp. WSM3859]
MALADDIRMVQRHVELGKRHLSRQHHIVQQFSSDGLPTDDAIDLLHLFEDMQALHRVHLSRLLRKAVDSN